MKILNIVFGTENARGGGVRAGLLYGKYLSKYVDTTLVKMAGIHDKDLFSEIELDSNSVLILPQKKNIKNIIKILPFFPDRYSNVFVRTAIDPAILREHDLVHIHNPMPVFGMKQIADLCKKSDIPYVVTLHGIPETFEMPDIMDMSRLNSWIYNKIVLKKVLEILRNASHLFALSKSDQEQMKNFFPKSNITISPNGIDISNYKLNSEKQKLRKILCKKYNIDNKDNVILFVGGLYERKGVDTLIKATKKLRENFQLLIVGPVDIDTKYKKYIDKLIAENDRIKLLGYVPKNELVQLYQLADIFVLPSLSEAFGMVLIEAMAGETPCISSDITGPNEIIQHGETGFLFPKKDVDSLANYLSVLLENKKIREKMGKKAYKIVKEKYDWDIIVKDNLPVYNEIC